ncbi:MAG: hypothetical protein ATN31_08390 [Candidatus Epulonipiscioides saccharophilum]|nr:MAG: hypothetical protein ATN31_08390 [Epulopiscium sp. AS2M-Bin001]
MNYQTKQYDTIDIIFQAKFDSNFNPFTNLTFEAIIEKDGVFLQNSFGVYNGETDFLLRLSFCEAGLYTYKILSNLSDLDGQIGEISVIENNAKHGPLALNSNNKTKLYYKDGSPYQLYAFECDWLFAIDYHEKTNQLQQLIDYFSDNHVNQIIMNVYANNLRFGGEAWILDENMDPAHNLGDDESIFPFKGSNSNPDFTALNVDFFKHLDKVIRLLDDKNIISHLMIYVWNKQVNWPEAYSVLDDMYFDYVVKRYAAFSNIFWDVSKEALAYGKCDANYIIDRTLRLKKMDPYKRLITVHDYGFCKKYPDLVDVISIQTWALGIYEETRKLTALYPNKPVFNLEHGGYEEGQYQVFTGHYTNAKTCLKRNYEIMFAGAYSAYYWQPLSWCITVMPWLATPQPHFDYYKNMIDLFTTYDYSQLYPINKFGKFSGGGYLLANKENTLVLGYIPKENYCIGIGYIEHYKGIGTYCFFNTITGEYTQKTKLDGKQRKIISPFEDDTIIIIDMRE